MMDENRRNFSRVKFNSTVKLSLNGSQVEAGLLDISLKGALVSPLSPVQLVKGDTCHFEFHLSESNIILKVNSVVVYQQDAHLGLKFGNIDLESMIHLRRLVELNVGDPEKIQKELFFLASTEI